jgi:hypothetical protein
VINHRERLSGTVRHSLVTTGLPMAIALVAFYFELFEATGSVKHAWFAVACVAAIAATGLSWMGHRQAQRASALQDPLTRSRVRANGLQVVDALQEVHVDYLLGVIQIGANATEAERHAELERLAVGVSLDFRKHRTALDAFVSGCALLEIPAALRAF